MKVDQIDSGERWDVGRVVRFIDRAAGSDTIDVAARTSGVRAKWVGNNRAEIAQRLLKQGWVITSVSHGEEWTAVWFEPLE